MRAYADHAREYLRRNAIGGRTIDRRFEPRLVQRVAFGVRAKGLNEDVDVAEDQSRSSKRSSRLPLSLRSTPALMPPPARHAGSVTIARSDRFMGRRKASCSPCSSRDVSVTPRRSASCRTRCKRLSSNRNLRSPAESASHAIFRASIPLNRAFQTN